MQASKKAFPNRIWERDKVKKIKRGKREKSIKD